MRRTLSPKRLAVAGGVVLATHLCLAGTAFAQDEEPVTAESVQRDGYDAEPDARTSSGSSSARRS